MVPTLKFRWLVLSNPVSRTMIDAYRALHDVSLNEARKQITCTQKPVLQQWWAPEGWSTDPLLWDCGEWRTIETVIEPHPASFSE